MRVAEKPLPSSSRFVYDHDGFQFLDRVNRVMASSEEFSENAFSNATIVPRMGPSPWVNPKLQAADREAAFDPLAHASHSPLLPNEDVASTFTLPHAWPTPQPNSGVQPTEGAIPFVDSPLDAAIRGMKIGTLGTLVGTTIGYPIGNEGHQYNLVPLATLGGAIGTIASTLGATRYIDPAVNRQATAAAFSEAGAGMGSALLLTSMITFGVHRYKKNATQRAMNALEAESVKKFETDIRPYEEMIDLLNHVGEAEVRRNDLPGMETDIQKKSAPELKKTFELFQAANDSKVPTVTALGLRYDAERARASFVPKDANGNVCGKPLPVDLSVASPESRVFAHRLRNSRLWNRIEKEAGLAEGSVNRYLLRRVGDEAYGVTPVTAVSSTARPVIGRESNQTTHAELQWGKAFFEKEFTDTEKKLTQKSSIRHLFDQQLCPQVVELRQAESAPVYPGDSLHAQILALPGRGKAKSDKQFLVGYGEKMDEIVIEQVVGATKREIARVDVSQASRQANSTLENLGNRVNDGGNSVLIHFPKYSGKSYLCSQEKIPDQTGVEVGVGHGRSAEGKALQSCHLGIENFVPEVVGHGEMHLFRPEELRYRRNDKKVERTSGRLR